jgi:quercetin dioxygenase-like cupin family protein
MPTLVGFGTFAALVEEQISEKISRRILSGDQGMIVWWSIGAGVHVEPHSHPNEQIVWMLKGKMEFRLGSEQSESAARATSWSFREVRNTRDGFAKIAR